MKERTASRILSSSMGGYLIIIDFWSFIFKKYRLTSKVNWISERKKKREREFLGVYY